MSLSMLTHRKLFYFGKSKNWQKSNQKCHLIFSKNCVDTCWNSQWLRGHFGKFEAFSQILKEQSVKKRYLDVFTYTSNNNNLKIFKSPYLKKKLGHWLRWHPIFELCNPLSPQKRKISRNSFCLFIWGPGRIF